MTLRPQTQQGMALVEALIASAVLGIGLLGATQLTLQTLHTAHQNRQHTVAQQLAQEAMDCLRAPSQLAAHGEESGCPGEEVLHRQGVRYTRHAHSTFGADGGLSDLHVRVTWPVQPEGHLGLINWHSSVSDLPSWVGVSLP